MIVRKDIWQALNHIGNNFGSQFCEWSRFRIVRMPSGRFYSMAYNGPWLYR